MNASFPCQEESFMDPQIEDALNKQINHELASSYHYLAIEAHFEEMNLSGFARWMHVQYEEEQDHAMRLYRYLLDRGGKIALEAINKPPTGYGSPLEVFQAALELEQMNTRAINELYSLAMQVNDYATMTHLHWFLDEQVEEEKREGVANELLDDCGVA